MKTIIRHLFAGMLLTFVMSHAYGVAPYPGKITVTQSDGSTLAVTRVGDAFFNVMLTDDGYPLMYNSSTRNHEYAVFHDGRLECSGIAASAKDERTEAENTFIAALDLSVLTTALDLEWTPSM